MRASKKIGMDSRVGRKREMAVTQMDEEKVMLDIQKGVYYAMNSVGGRIWDLLEEPRSVDSLVSCLREEYDVDPDTCRDQVLAYLTQMQEEGLAIVD